MRLVNCNYCGQNDTELVNEGPDLYLNRKTNYRLVRCRQCGLIYQNPQLSLLELSDHYPTNEYELYSKNTALKNTTAYNANLHHAMIRRYKRISQRINKPGSLLDVGCATGTFITVVQEQGWKVTGIEFNAETASYARNTFNLNVHSGTLEDIKLPNNSFDVVTFWDVFEHVQDPKATLAEVVRILKPNGLLVIALPNPNSLEARIFGAYWAGWDRPRHLYLFPPQLLKQYLKDAGFSHVTIESFSGRLSVTLLSVAYWLTAHSTSQNDVTWRHNLKIAYNPITRLITWPIYRLAEAFNQTTNMTAFAQL